MKRFAQLYQELDETMKTRHKVASLVRYFQQVSPSDAAWAMWFLCGNRPRRAVPVGKLREWCAEISGIPEWLFAETYDFVGDLAETIALMLPSPQNEAVGTLTEWINDRLMPLAAATEEEKKTRILSAWMELNQLQRFVFNKLLTGGFRVGVSQKLVIKALAEFSGVPADVIAHRLMGQWKPTAAFFESLMSAETDDADASRPYPFCLANSLVLLPTDGDSLFDSDVERQMTHQHGPVSNWIMEWKWDGIRAQIVRRGGATFVWSRGEELLTERFPEILVEAEKLPDGTVLDGEIVGWKSGQVLPFADLQKRITRKSVGKKLLADIPVRFLAFDLLEHNGADLRSLPLVERRRLLSEVYRVVFEGDSDTPASSAESLVLSPLLHASSWTDAVALRQSSRQQRVEGLMLKDKDREYGVGRVVGLWWKWKVEPYHCDAVLIYGQRGHGRRASKFTDYTFAAWENGQLVPFAKAYSGLTNEEIREVDKFIRENTLERFGPVQSVKAELVFELAFEGIQLSNRHKSGLAVRFPRIARWRKDKKPEDADTLQAIRGLVRMSPADAESPSGRDSTPSNVFPPGSLFAGMELD